ncbi:MAG: hypothetical protein P8Y28_01070 [Gammaproteobacteria bacterium]
MRMQHIRAMARKEWWHLFRDPRSLALILLMPTMLLFLFGYAIRLDITEAPIGILQESRDALTNDIAAHFDAIRLQVIMLTATNCVTRSSMVTCGEPLYSRPVFPETCTMAVRSCS